MKGSPESKTAVRAGRVVVVGGGLAGCLLAYRLARGVPGVDVQLLEAGHELGKDHTWSFHGRDLAPASRAGEVLDPSWVRELASCSWDGYDVRFPGFARTLAGAYHSLRSRDLHERLVAELGGRVRFGAKAQRLAAHEVELEDGTVIPAGCVVDARGLYDAGAACAWQTFFGLFVRTAAPHGLSRPILMDATVPQRGGFRFLYTLPFGERDLLVEDTRYSESRAVDEAGARAFLPDYLRALGVASYEERGAEAGALAIPLSAARPPRPLPGVVALGAGAGLFHPTTGYSLREAALSADLFARHMSRRGLQGLAALFADHAEARWRSGGFYRRLNNMLFMAAAPDARWKVMETFYRRDARLVGRFYAQELTLLDRLKILSGRPPVPVVRGVAAFCAGAARA